MDSATIAIRTDPEVKKAAQQVFKGLGIDMSSAINMFLKQVVNDGGMPLRPTLSSFERRVRQTEPGPKRSFDSVDDLMAEINGRK